MIFSRETKYTVIINGEKDLTLLYQNLADKRIDYVKKQYFNQQINGGYWQGKDSPVFTIEVK